MHYIESFDVEVTVVFNDQIDLDEVAIYDKIVLSPGPGLPHEAGQLMEVIERYATTKPFFGVCLGFQALVSFYGGTLFNQQTVKHGVAENVHFDTQSSLFTGTEAVFKVGLYHSWAASDESFPKCLEITGKSEHAVIMAFAHKTLPIVGVQFHPESILSLHGKKIVENFIFNIS